MYIKSYLFRLISLAICAIFITSCSGKNTRRIGYQPTLAYDEPEPIDADIDLPVHPPTTGPGSYYQTNPENRERRISDRYDRNKNPRHNPQMEDYNVARQIPCQNSVAQEWSISSLRANQTRMINRRNKKCLDLTQGGAIARKKQVAAGLLRCQDSNWQH